METETDENEVVITMGLSEYNRLDDAELLRRLRENAEIITLEWLDKKRAEFP